MRYFHRVSHPRINKKKLYKLRKASKDVFWDVRYKILSFLGYIYRNIFFKKIYFLDTNFVVFKKDDTDIRFKKLKSFGKKFAITLPIKSEMEELVSSGNFTKTNYKIDEEVSFEKLYMKYSGICPIYHNFISSMHNPATITSADFQLQSIFAKITKQKTLTSEENKLHAGIMAEVIKKSRSHASNGNSKSDELLNVIREAHEVSLRKRKVGLKGKNKNYPNDIRNLSLIFLYAILNKKNVTLITTDSDAVAYYYDWFGTIGQQATFKTRLLQILDKGGGMNDVVAGKKQAIFFDSTWIMKEIWGTTQKFYSNHHKYFSPRLSIKYWDKKRQKFFEIGVNISNDFRSYLIWHHGAFSCPTARNDYMGAFLGFRYWWPPTSVHNSGIFKIMPIMKPVYRIAKFIPPPIHDTQCRFRKADLASSYKEFSSFTG